jgi:hypothetical protein
MADVNETSTALPVAACVIRRKRNGDEDTGYLPLPQAVEVNVKGPN